MADPDELLNKRVRALAKEHGLSVRKTLAALDQHPIEVDRNSYLKRTLALELLELDSLATAFREKALVDRDVASGLLLLKVAERRATILGLNAPQGFAVQVVQHEPATKLTTTQELAVAIARIRGQSLPKPDEFDDSPEVN